MNTSDPKLRRRRSAGRDRPRRRTSSLLRLVALLLATACFDESDVPEGDRSNVASTIGVVTVVRAESHAPGIAPQLQLNAAFARYRGFSAADVVDFASLEDVPDWQLLELPIGHCQVVQSNASAIGTAGGRTTRSADGGIEDFVDFLEAGELRALGSQDIRQARFERRALPELWTTVSGVTYEATLPLSAAERPISIDGWGSQHAGSFRLEATVPPTPTLTEVGGQPVTAAYATIDWEEELDVRWETPVAPEGAAPTRLTVSLEALEFDRVVAFRCACPDIGSAGLPRAGIEALAPFARGEATVRLVVRRTAQIPFAAARVHEAMAFFVARSSVLVK
ncbi:MAG: hypothetical protein IV100_14555 [Myxococcales bacterium]|nr:hypothetical protein [Myxococcales bacterium]